MINMRDMHFGKLCISTRKLNDSSISAKQLKESINDSLHVTDEDCIRSTVESPRLSPSSQRRRIPGVSPNKLTTIASVLDPILNHLLVS